jgi:hypothetical protein
LPAITSSGAIHSRQRASAGPLATHALFNTIAYPSFLLCHKD